MKLTLALSLFVASHNLPFSALEHLNSLLKINIDDSKIVKNLNINRKKAQKITKYAIAPENTKFIKNITKDQYYSLIIDESTHITTEKNLAVIIRVFENEVKDRFLGLIPVEDSSAQGLFNGLKEFLDKNEIPLCNLLSFSADNCSVMMGVKNGVQAKLKQIVPNLFVHGCVCHNLNIISKRAFLQLPQELDNILKKINHHFCNSSTRQSKFMEFQEYFGSNLHKILSLSTTRWLSRQVIFKNIFIHIFD